MSEKKPSYEDLERRAREAEEFLAAMRRGEVDALVIEQGVLVLRLREAERALDLSHRILQISARHADIKPLLREVVAEIKAYTGCSAVGIRLLDEKGNIPYQAYEGFTEQFYELESPLSIKSDHCMCINVIKGATDPALPFYTNFGSFYMNGTSQFLATVSEEEKGQTRNTCNRFGYESVALIPIRLGQRILGLIHVADERDDRTPLDTVERLEGIAMELANSLERLRASERSRRLSAIVESSDDIIIGGMLDGTIASWNRGAERAYGYSAEEVLGKPVSILCPPERKGEVEALTERIKQGEMIEHFDTVRVRKDGKRIDVSISVSPVKDEAGRIIGIAAIGRDITERKRRDREERERLRLHQSTLATVPSAILVLDAGLRVVMANRSCADVLGLPPAEVAGELLADLLPASLLAHESLQEQVQAIATAGGAAEAFGVRYSASGRDEKFLDIRVHGIRCPEAELAAAEEGHPSVLMVLTDVTEQRRLQEQLRQAAKVEAIGKLAGGVAHDFNNMLTGISGYTEFALSEVDPQSKAHDDLLQVRKLARRAAGLTQQLLAFSRKQTLELAPTHLNKLIENVINMLKRLIGEDIELCFAPAPSLGIVRVDRGQIDQILMNLAVNARDAMPQGGKLTIETANVVLDEAYAKAHVGVKPGAYVMCAVADSGCGMDPETQAQIFDPFFTTKEVGRGTGLGLSTVYGIVKQHGGNIWVYSEPGQGTTFKIYLPRVDSDAKGRSCEPDPQEAPKGSETILVVEDESVVRDIASRVLRGQGYTVFVAASPNEAEEVFAQHADEIDLVLTDVVMPQRSGRKLHERLAAMRDSIKVLYMSGYTDNAIVHHGVLDPGTAFIQKPFNAAALARKIRSVLDG